jgi:allantoinase
MADLAVRSRRVLTPHGEREATVVIRGERIAELAALDAALASVEVVEAGDLVVLPGLVDSHVHVNEPGRTEWEGFETATRAAAAGGVTTLVDMPLNSIPVTTSAAALATKLDAARGRVAVDCAFWGGVVPGNAKQLEPMLDAGVRGFKAFLIDSGIDDFPASGEEDLREALAVLQQRGAPLLAHAELAGYSADATGDTRRYATYLASRPRAWENDAIRLLIGLAREFRTSVHIVHLSSSDAVRRLAEARADGVRITAETCPHYLSFDAEEIGDSRTEFKCAPPIREAENRERLWAGLRDGVIDLVVSDHSPCTPKLKGADFMGAWGGIASVQFALPAVWTEARRRGVPLTDVARWMSEAPALLAGLGGRKGRLAPGYDADLVIFDPDASFAVAPSLVRHRHIVTPYLGRTLQGVVKATYLRGRPIYADGAALGAPSGALLLERRDGLH